MKIFSRPYHLLLLASVVFLFLCIFLPSATIDLPLEDSYYIMNRAFLFGGFTVLLFVSWVVHRVPDDLLLSRFITWFYALATIGCMALIGTFPLWGHLRPEGATGAPVLPEGYVDYIPYIIGLFIVAQVLLFINVLVGMYSKLRHIPRNPPKEYYYDIIWKQYLLDKQKKKDELSRSQR